MGMVARACAGIASRSPSVVPYTGGLVGCQRVSWVFYVVQCTRSHSPPSWKWQWKEMRKYCRVKLFNKVIAVILAMKECSIKKLFQTIVL